MTAETESEAEARAWEEVVRAWEDEARHRAYLDRQASLDGLAVAGRRYREALEARPGDPVALRWRDEVLRRATVAGLSLLPRVKPVALRAPRWTRPVALVVVGVLLVLAFAAFLRVIAEWRAL
jgi:hypothetical protein